MLYLCFLDKKKIGWKIKKTKKDKKGWKDQATLIVMVH